MRKFLAATTMALLLTASGCSSLIGNSGDSGQITCENKDEYWVDDINGCLTEQQVINWVGSACYCETYAACEARGFPEFGADGAGCDAETYEWVDGDSENLQALTSEDLPEGAVLWSDAVKYNQTEVQVCGEIMGVSKAETTAGRPTLIDLGKRFPDKTRVTAVVWEADLENFETDLKETYRVGNLCVTGHLQRSEGALQVEVSTPEQFLLLH